MTPGSMVDQALGRTYKAAGKLALMVVKKKLMRSHLEDAATELEEGARLIRSALKVERGES